MVFKAALGEVVRLSDGWVDLVRRNELLVVCLDPVKRMALQRVYLDTLLDLAIPTARIRTEATYTTYSEVVSTLRDEIASDARSAAASLADFDSVTSAEICARVVMSHVRRFINSAARSRPTHTLSPLAGVALHADVSHELGGISQLIHPVLKELHAARAVRPVSTPERKCALVAARRLFRVAENWQVLTYIRQRVATGDAQVERVERNGVGTRLIIVPTRPEEAWRAPAVQRRVSSIGSRVIGAEREQVADFPADTGFLAATICHAFLSNAASHPNAAEKLTRELDREVAKTIRPVDGVLFRSAPTDGARLIA